MRTPRAKEPVTLHLVRTENGILSCRSESQAKRLSESHKGEQLCWTGNLGDLLNTGRLRRVTEVSDAG